MRLPVLPESINPSHRPLRSAPEEEIRSICTIREFKDSLEPRIVLVDPVCAGVQGTGNDHAA